MPHLTRVLDVRRVVGDQRLFQVGDSVSSGISSCNRWKESRQDSSLSYVYGGLSAPRFRCAKLPIAGDMSVDAALCNSASMANANRESVLLLRTSSRQLRFVGGYVYVPSVSGQ